MNEQQFLYKTVKYKKKKDIVKKLPRSCTACVWLNGLIWGCCSAWAANCWFIIRNCNSWKLRSYFLKYERAITGRCKIQKIYTYWPYDQPADSVATKVVPVLYPVRPVLLSLVLGSPKQFEAAAAVLLQQQVAAVRLGLKHFEKIGLSLTECIELVWQDPVTELVQGWLGLEVILPAGTQDAHPKNIFYTAKINQTLFIVE